MNFIGLDLSTKTGFVKLDQNGEILEAKEIHTPYETAEKMDEAIGIIDYLLELDDFVSVEGFSYGSKGKSVDKQYGIGWLLRIYLYRSDIKHIIVPPSTLKNFAGAKGNAKKDVLAVEIFKRWGYEHTSDNVRDAFVLAHMARAIHYPTEYLKSQQEVLQKAVGGKK